MPLLLTGQTLQAWLTAEQVSLRRIAAMSSVGLACTLQFAWAPLRDRFALPLLGRRRGWVLVFQLGLVAASGDEPVRSAARARGDRRDRNLRRGAVGVAGHGARRRL